MTRLVLFGLDCGFTRGVLKALAERGIRPALLILPGPPGSGVAMVPLRDERTGKRTLSLQVSATITDTAQQRPPTPQAQPMAAYAERTVRAGSPRDAELVQIIVDTQPDAIAVACYLQRIPARISDLAPLALNVHPSLLPRHRGPDPLFWTFQAGDNETGVTIHELAHDFDSGAIHAQERHALPPEAVEDAIEALLAARGGELLADVLKQATAQPTPQDTSLASVESWPGDDDLVLMPDWSAERAWRCLHGLRDRRMPFVYRSAGNEAGIGAPIRYGMAADGSPDVAADEALLRFADGWVLARRA